MNVITFTDYYPGGSIMPGRSFNANAYRYGWNKGSEKDDEITGVTGSHYTTYFREFDTRLNRTWSVDPSYVPWESPYAVNRNNSIAFVDPLGNFPKVGKAIKQFGRNIGSLFTKQKWGSKTRLAGNKYKVAKPSRWQGLANVFRRNGNKRAAPAGRARNQGWTNWTAGSVFSSGNPLARTNSVNVFGTVGSRGTLTGIDVRGNASNALTRFSITGGTSQANQRSLFSSNGLQNVTSNGSLFSITDSRISGFNPGDFQARSGFLPFLNSLPAIVQFLRSPFGVFAGDNASNYNMGAIAATSLWMSNAFNHKPLLSGKVWSLRFSAYSPMGGRVNYQYRYKYKSWTPNTRTLWRRILYGY